MRERKEVVKNIVGEVIEAMWAYGVPDDWYDHETYTIPKELRKALRRAVDKAMPTLTQEMAVPGLTDGPAEYTVLVEDTTTLPASVTVSAEDRVAYRQLKSDNRELRARVKALEMDAERIASARDAEAAKWRNYPYNRPSPNWTPPGNPLEPEVVELLRAVVAEQEMERMRMGLTSTFPQVVVGMEAWDKARAQVVERRRVAEKNLAVAFAKNREAVLTFLDAGL